MNRPWLRAWTWVAWLTAGCGPAPSLQLGATEQAIRAGTEDRGHDAVAAALLMSPTGAIDVVCSGVLIAGSGSEGTVLTAAHCVLDGDSSGITPLARMCVRFGRDFRDPVATAVVTRAVVHPRYASPGPASADDFALLEVHAVAPTALPAPMGYLADDGLMVGASVLLVGYGQTSPEGEAQGLRFRAEQTTLALSTLTVIHEGSSSACSGDSGGPILVRTPDGEKVVGIVSSGRSDCRGGGDER